MTQDSTSASAAAAAQDPVPPTADFASAEPPHTLGGRLPSQGLGIPVSDGSYVTANGDTCIVRSNYTGSISISRDKDGRRVVKEEPREEARLPPSRLC